MGECNSSPTGTTWRAPRVKICLIAPVSSCSALRKFLKAHETAPVIHLF